MGNGPKAGRGFFTSGSKAEKVVRIGCVMLIGRNKREALRDVGRNECQFKRVCAGQRAWVSMRCSSSSRERKCLAEKYKQGTVPFCSTWCLLLTPEPPRHALYQHAVNRAVVLRGRNMEPPHGFAASWTGSVIMRHQRAVISSR